MFASCGGGGLLSGTYLAKQKISPTSMLIGTEPLNANDAFISLQQNSIFSFSKSPRSIADGLCALSISARTFKYLKKLDDMVLLSENDIYYWTHYLNNYLRILCEPSSAINMAAAYHWLLKQIKPKTILIIISGGNLNSQLCRITDPITL